MKKVRINLLGILFLSLMSCGSDDTEPEVPVDPVNNPPVAVDDAYSMVEDEAAITLTPLDLDTDLDDDTLSIVSINGTTLTPGTAQTLPVTNGTVEVAVNGTITFTPDANYNGEVKFAYVISDGTDTATAYEIITVDAIPFDLNKRVLVIGIDGCMPAGVTAANTPNLDALMANGTFSLDARNTKTTSSGPAWSSILTGVWEEKHGVTSNSFSNPNFDTYPPVFKYIKDVYPESRNVSIVEWAQINDYIVLDHADSKIKSSNASDTESKAITELGVDELTSLFLHFDAPDHAGHASGYSVTNSHYIDAIEEVDASIGGVVAAMKARTNYADEDWIVVVTTDHGGIGTGHGGDSEEERTIFMIVSGDSVTNKEIAKTTTETTIPPVTNCLDSDTELYFNRNGIVEVPNNAAHNFGASQDFSVECRFRSDSPSDVSIVGKKDWDSGTRDGFVFSFKPSTQKFKVNVGDGVNRVDVETAIITDNEWHTVSATFDRDGLLKVYIDGTLSNSESMSTIGNIDNSFPLTIGADGNGNYKFDGYVSEVRVFNELLSADDIDTWKCTPLDNTHSKYANLQGYWKLTEGTGTTINDSSSKALNGTLTGAEWKDAKVAQIVETHDYSNTPRSVDVVSTALTHLCIPIESSWNLDSNALIESNCEN